MTNNTLIIMPTYNEKDNIEPILEKILSYDCCVLFVDDNSPDKTADIIKNIMAKNNKVKLLQRPGKLGLGSAYVAGFKYAIENKYKNIIMMDADLSHPHTAIPAMLNSSADFVVGSRYIKGGKITADWPWYRYILSSYANMYARIMLSFKVKDVTAGFNRISVSVLKAINIDNLKSEGYGFQIELKFCTRKHDFTFDEIPITFTERQRGVSKMSKKIIWEAFWLVLKLKLFGK
jgi:dolichol-phosphate mannosyltransferase